MTFQRNKWKKETRTIIILSTCIYVYVCKCLLYLLFLKIRISLLGKLQTILTTLIYISRIVLNSSTFTNIKVKNKIHQRIIISNVYKGFSQFKKSTDQLNKCALGVKPRNIMQGQIWALLLFRMTYGIMDCMISGWHFFFYSFLFVV